MQPALFRSHLITKELGNLLTGQLVAMESTNLVIVEEWQEKRQFLKEDQEEFLPFPLGQVGGDVEEDVPFRGDQI